MVRDGRFGMFLQVRAVLVPPDLTWPGGVCSFLHVSGTPDNTEPLREFRGRPAADRLR
jgi:hypothetical protein